jgi:beta-N-acetylhexosaminidase
MLMKSIRILWIILLTVSLLSSHIGFAQASVNPQTSVPADKAAQLMEKMTAEEKVGQLFLVTVKGSSADANSQVHDLINHYYIGGVILSRSNDNFSDSPNTIPQAIELIRTLQSTEWQSQELLGSNETPTTSTTLIPTTSQPAATKITSTPENPSITHQYIPLFIGLSQEGDGFPNDQILHGLTTMPDLMSIGATWNPSLAKKVGTIIGRELSSIGINLFLGPSLDVEDSPDSTILNGLGASAFGGDPYWVGTLGSEYVAGLHSGSEGRMAVIADHFPGRGSADRPFG